MFQTEHLQEKWRPVLEHNDLPEIKDSIVKPVTTVILENQEKSMKVRTVRSFQKQHQQTMWVRM